MSLRSSTVERFVSSPQGDRVRPRNDKMQDTAVSGKRTVEDAQAVARRAVMRPSGRTSRLSKSEFDAACAKKLFRAQQELARRT